MVQRPKPRSVLGRAVTVLIAFVLVATACSDDSGDAEPDAEPTTEAPGGNAPVSRRAGPLSVRLSQGEALTTPVQPEPPVDGTPLDGTEVDAIFARLPDWTVPETDRQDFNRPAETLPPPLTGETVDAPFPAEGDEPPPEVPSGPLEVLRYQPDGSVPIAPSLSLSFNQPMVPLATLDQLDALDVPATITPDIAGRWQWIGTKTLRFEHTSDEIDRLPMATSYTVGVPAGTTSESGGELADAFTFGFETPTVQVQGLWPDHDSLSLEPVFLLTFDQRVDAEAVLATVSLTAGNDERELRLATDNEIQADDDLRERVSGLLDDRWIAFRAVDAFAPDTAVAIAVGPDVPSAEGPNTSDDVTRFDVRTYAPLRVEDQTCRAGDDYVCRPGDGLWMRFNNELDVDAFDESMITIEPEIPGAYVFAQYQSIEIRGVTAGRTTYEVTISGDVADTFGQTLGDAEDLSFVFGPARTQLGQFDRPVITLDPLAETPTIPLLTTNHDEVRVRMFAVDPVADWAAFSTYWERRWRPETRLPAWTAAVDTTLAIGGDDDRLTETSLDLEAALSGAPGNVVVLVEPAGQLANLTENDERYWDNRPAVVWVQSTGIGLDVFADADEARAWTTDLATGEPLEGVEVTQPGTQAGGLSDDEGLALLPLADLSATDEGIVLAALDDDSAFIPVGHTLAVEPRNDQLLAHVFDDRGIYRPGETVRVKGWIRNLTTSSDARLTLFDPGTTVRYVVNDWYGNELVDGSVDVNALGGFDLEIDLADGANLGEARIDFRVPVGGNREGGFAHQFRIEEFRRPEFEVSARAETPGPYLVHEPATVAVDAEYFAGGALPDAPVDWLVSTRTAQYSPPNWEDFTFGIWTPWWYDDVGFGRGFVDEGGSFPEEDPVEYEEFSGTTDADGTHYLRMDFDGDADGQPTTVSAQATVYDVNRQAWSSTTDLLVHPGALYVGLRSIRTFVREGDPLTIEAIVTDIDGAAVAGRSLTVEAARLEWRYVDGEWDEVPVDTESCEVTTAAEPVECEFATDRGGRYRMSADAVDDAGRRSRTELTRWVSGGDQVPTREVRQEEATLVPDAEEYAPGDVAEILVESPFGPAQGLLTLSRNGFVSTETFEVADGTAVLEIPIEDRYTPNLSVQVDLVGATERTADDGTPLPDVADRPAFATGSLTLSVPPVRRTLSVAATPVAPTLDPGTDTSVDVTVADADGAPVEGAELAVVVVDEAVLALTDYELGDPLDTFYGPISSQVYARYGRESIVLTNPEDLAEGEQIAPTTTVGTGDDTAADDGGGDVADAAPAAEAFSRTANQVGGADQPIDVRTDFDALAVWDPEVVTDAEGNATIEVPLPDSLTRYRVMVVAVDGADRFGSAESNITARLPLQVRPSPPRFLNFGDTFELPVVLQNQTSQDMDVDVAVQTANLELIDVVGRRVTVPADDRIEVRFPAAVDAVGTARFRVAAVSGDHADAATLELPVYTPATAEAFATYGVVDDGAVIQPLLAPEGVFPQFGGLEVNTSSTALQALTDAVLYLNDYPYESADALASRILAVAALRDVLDAFDAEGLPDPASLNENVRRDIDKLVGLQNPDGGFGWWGRGRSYPFVSIQAVHALVMARDAGYSVADEPYQRSLDYLRDIENRIPPDYDQRTKDTLSAYALHVRLLAGDRDTDKAQRLYDRAGDDLGLDAVAWLWPVLDDEGTTAEIERLFANRATETAGAVTFTTDYGEQAYLLLHSDRRTDGIILDALIREAPDSELIPKVVAGLLGNQIQGRWNNVQENSFILLALNNYFDTFEDVTPDFVARIWLGDLYAGEHEYRGRSTDRGVTGVPMAEVVAGGDTDLIVAKDGAGRLYYRLGMRYAPDDLDLDPLDRGFVVSRTYEGVDDPDDVRRDQDGVWHVRAGADVRVRLAMVADSRRTNMALVDPLPAGLEAQNPALAVTGDQPPVDEPEDLGFEGDVQFESDVAFPTDLSYWWWGPWYEHQNLRDDRVEAFASLLPAGTYDYTYVARATTPGTFVVPPTKAEEIYAPETFGRSSSDVLIVEEN